MPFEPQKITIDNIHNAINKITTQNISLKPSLKFDVIIDNKPYPPKEVMKYAHQDMNGELIWELDGGNPTNNYLTALGFKIKTKEVESTLISYYVLGAAWYGNEDNPNQTERFINQGIWENGYEDKFLDVVNGVNVGDRVAIKSSFATRTKKSYLRVKAIGTVTNNIGNGRKLEIEWDERFPPFDLEGYGGYRNTIQKVNPDDVNAIFNRLHTPLSTTPVEDTTSKNIILYGPPGTGKTYNSIDMAVEIITGKNTLSHSDNKTIFDTLKLDRQIEFVTFHQNYSYEDFMVGLKPDVDNDILKFKSHKGIFYEISKRAKENYLASKQGKSLSRNFDEAINELLKPFTENDIEVDIKMASGIVYKINDVTDSTIFFKKAKGDSKHTLSIQTVENIVEGKRLAPRGLEPYYTPLVEKIKELMKPIEGAETEKLKKFVLIIDEINRANISKVFGELITLLEEDKRLGQENELKITLPNGEREFCVSPNLYIIGTMNTADKSIALIDIALRRRFEFIGYYPSAEVLSELVSNGQITKEKSELLKQINKEIFEKRNSADYLIGHAYFINKKPIDEVLRDKIIPLLMEYFSGKTKQVSEVFSKTKWKVEYNDENYIWDLTLK